MSETGMLAVTIPFHFSLRLHHENNRKRNEIHWKILTQRDNFADDLTLMSHNHQHMQDNTTDLAQL